MFVRWKDVYCTGDEKVSEVVGEIKFFNGRAIFAGIVREAGLFPVTEEHDIDTENILEIVDGKPIGIKGEIEVIYTGGNIWIAGMYIDRDHYYAISSGDDDINEPCLSYFDATGDDEPGFMCQAMLWSKSLDECTDEEKAIWDKMHTALLRDMC